MTIAESMRQLRHDLRLIGRERRLNKAVRLLDKAQSLMLPEMQRSVTLSQAWMRLWKVLGRLS
jgi:hypothetical protein